MKRLYFLTPSIQSTSDITDELHHLGVTNENIHVVGKNHERLQAAHIHEAGLLETTDVAHAMRAGAKYGLIFGTLAGLTAAVLLPISIWMKLFSIIGLGLFGAAFGAWASSLVGISIPEPGVEKYEDAIKNGQLLMLIDVDEAREHEIASLIRNHHPEARVGSARMN